MDSVYFISSLDYSSVSLCSCARPSCAARIATCKMEDTGLFWLITAVNGICFNGSTEPLSTLLENSFHVGKDPRCPCPTFIIISSIYIHHRFCPCLQHQRHSVSSNRRKDSRNQALSYGCLRTLVTSTSTSTQAQTLSHSAASVA
jgi:hypothetical protein